MRSKSHRYWSLIPKSRNSNKDQKIIVKLYFNHMMFNFFFFFVMATRLRLWDPYLSHELQMIYKWNVSWVFRTEEGAIIWNINTIIPFLTYLSIIFQILLLLYEHLYLKFLAYLCQLHCQIIISLSLFQYPPLTFAFN